MDLGKWDLSLDPDNLSRVDCDLNNLDSDPGVRVNTTMCLPNIPSYYSCQVNFRLLSLL